MLVRVFGNTSAHPSENLNPSGGMNCSSINPINNSIPIIAFATDAKFVLFLM